MAGIDEILNGLNTAQFESALAGATQLSTYEWHRFHAETRNTEGMSKYPYFAEPGHYPASRLLQTCALAGLQRYAAAQAVINDEITRLHQHAHSRTDALLAFHIGLSAIVSTETQNRMAGMERYERLVEQVSSNAAKRHGCSLSPYYLRADLRDVISHTLETSSIHALVGMPLTTLLRRLDEQKYCVQLQVSGGDYDMPGRQGTLGLLDIKAA
ncbi:hypothetical protein HYV82_03130 [Candidatus Woesearchaeota archaeon]|nr:hypothetical protein [Candidatus Woesearchaeota archaeon]